MPASRCGPNGGSRRGVDAETRRESMNDA